MLISVFTNTRLLKSNENVMNAKISCNLHSLSLLFTTAIMRMDVLKRCPGQLVSNKLVLYYFTMLVPLS